MIIEQIILFAKKIVKSILPKKVWNYLKTIKNSTIELEKRRIFTGIISKRAGLSFSDVANLSKDISFDDWKPTEENYNNEFYGNASTLKCYVGLPESYQIRAGIQHGVFLDGVWKEEADMYPSFLCHGINRVNLYRQLGKNVHAIGMPFFYSYSLLDEDEIYLEKKRLGRTLTVFPTHSSHWRKRLYDINLFVNKINRFEGEFDSIRISIYWKDIDAFKFFSERGFECVCSGHIFDTNFLRRQNSIIKISDAIYSNSFGSHVVYSVYMNKPVLVERQNFFYHGKSKGTMVNGKGDESKKLNEFYSVFSNNFNITDAKISFLNKYCGLNQKKSRSELLQILYDCEKYYQESTPSPM